MDLPQIGDIVTWRFHETYHFHLIGFVTKVEEAPVNSFGATKRYHLTPFVVKNNEDEGKTFVFFDNEFGPKGYWKKYEQNEA